MVNDLGSGGGGDPVDATDGSTLVEDAKEIEFPWGITDNGDDTVTVSTPSSDGSHSGALLYDGDTGIINGWNYVNDHPASVTIPAAQSDGDWFGIVNLYDAAGGASFSSSTGFNNPDNTTVGATPERHAAVFMYLDILSVWIQVSVAPDPRIPRQRHKEQDAISGGSNYSAGTRRDLLLAQTGGGSIDIHLGSEFEVDGLVTVVKDVDGSAGTNPVTVDSQNTATFDGSASASISTNYGSLSLLYDSSRDEYLLV